MKRHCQRVQRQSIGWEEMFASHVYGKGLTSRIHKEQLNLKMSKEFEETFLQRRYPNGPHERMPNIISHQGNADQNHCIPVKMAIIFLRENEFGQ